MKNFKSLLIIICLLMPSLKSSAQGYGIGTQYYDYSTTLLNSNEIGEQGVTDNSDNLYVAGTYNRDGNGGIHIIKYAPNGNSLASASHNFSSNLSERVIKMFWGSNSQLYVICKAISPVAAANGLIVYRYNSSLTLLNIIPDFFAGFSPEKACKDASNNLYIAGVTTNGSTSNSLKVMKLNSACVLQTSYNYYYTNSTDNIVEEPKDMFFDTGSNNLYVAGRAVDTTTSQSAAILFKLNTSLSQQWNVHPALDTNRNVYNSIASYSGEIFVTGMAGPSKAWRVAVFNANQGYWVRQNDYTNSGFECEGLKITYAGANGIFTVGYRKSASQNKYIVIVRKFQYSTLYNPMNCYSETMTYTSQINDALTLTAGTTCHTFITGTKYVGGMQGNYNMFLRQVNATSTSGGTLAFSDSIVNHTAGGNKLVARNNAYNNKLSVIGYQDKASSFIQMHDYKWFTRTYSFIIQRQADQELTEESAPVLNIYPNPSSGIVNIKNTETIKKVSAFDMQGKTVLNTEFTDEAFGQQVDLTSLPKGIYIIRVNDGQTQRLVKN